MVAGIGLGLLLGMVNGFVITVLRVPSIVATLGTLSIYRGIDFLVAGGKQVTLGDLPPGYTDPARADPPGHPGLRPDRHRHRRGRRGGAAPDAGSGGSVYAVGSNPEAAAILGIRSAGRRVRRLRACGLLAGVAGVLWGIELRDDLRDRRAAA